jgi:hypothetical protein
MISVFADQQIIYSVEKNDNLGILQRFNSYNSFSFNNWVIENIAFVKISEQQQFPKEYYLRNYLRDKILVSYFGKNFKTVSFIGGEFFFRDNSPAHIGGWNGAFSRQNGYYGGAELTWNGQLLRFQFLINYMTHKFESEETTDNFSENEKFFDTDFMTLTKINLKDLKFGSLFGEIVHYDDLNESDIFDVTTFRIGDNFTKKIAFKYFIAQEIAAGYSDLHARIPFFGEYNLRFTGKFSQKWESLPSVVTTVPKFLKLLV